jgi:hypothetical protein
VIALPSQLTPVFHDSQKFGWLRLAIVNKKHAMLSISAAVL